MLGHLNLYFCDNLASEYAPIVYGGWFDNPKAEALYYRVVADKDFAELCIQYYLYWPEQVCSIASHRYDYEPIFLFLRPPKGNCYKIVNGGFSNDPINCRFHKTEIHTTGANRDEKEAQNKCMTSPLPFYPFGGEHCREVTSCVKQYPLEASMYFLDHHPLFGLRECSHVFSGDAQYFRDPKIDVPIRELTDEVLYKWYHKHYDSNYDQPFGHDVSNPFEFPHIKYFDPKELL